MYSKLLDIFLALCPFACVVTTMIYIRKSNLAKSRSEKTIAIAYMKKACFYYSAIWVLISGLVLYYLFFQMNLTQQIVMVLVILFLFIYVLPSHKKDLIEGVLSEKKKDERKDESYVGKGFFYIFSKVQLSWGLTLLFFAMMCYFYSLFPEGLEEPEPIPVLRCIMFVVTFFILGAPVCLMVALWKHIRMKRQRRDEQSEADLETLGLSIPEAI
ncbi:MAG: hypothetical protein ACO3BO_08640, partial [Anaerohalosphaeraceae bacterium]